jgi:hypothetical protein
MRVPIETWEIVLMRDVVLCLLFASSLSLAGPASLVAGMEPELILHGCVDREEREVESRAEGIPFIARAEFRPEQPLILINPGFREETFLSDQTLSWLYYRECAHIWRGHALEHNELWEREIDRYQEEAADCFAFNWLAEQHRYGDREIKLIMRDLEALDGREWERLQIGPRRIPDLYACRERKK